MIIMINFTVLIALKLIIQIIKLCNRRFKIQYSIMIYYPLLLFKDTKNMPWLTFKKWIYFQKQCEVQTIVQIFQNLQKLQKSLRDCSRLFRLFGQDLNYKDQFVIIRPPLHRPFNYQSLLRVLYMATDLNC